MTCRLSFAVAMVGVLSLGACQPAAPAFSDADRQAIRAVSDQFSRHFLAKSFDSLSQLYTEDAVLMPPNGASVVGRAAIREFIATFPPLSAISLTDEDVDGVGDLAYVRGRYQMTLAVEGTPTDSGKFVEVRRRQADGTWKLAVDIFNSNAPLPPPATPAKP